MDTLNATIRETVPDDPALGDLFDRHLSFTRATSPACSVHSKDASDLVSARARLFVLEDGGNPVAMAAFVVIAPGHGEIKSMHVAEAARGKGFGRQLLARVMTEAKMQGLERLSLETGSQPDFEPARGLYAEAGFEPTEPFGNYRIDPNSFFMTLCL